ncbi:eukaryotic and archaeal DNA primase, large subunit-domain-containing protein [Glomus cerebriforme]|uniref:DNA primase large subunit n=1 Tax=Glomus cerebriforme TaxID=658196 RepID=A0A397T832_9GLOM|nr:eukaryotic and archaeal DNA primase, large subunit-domain-containing protein [Glomus cerebriforme]
MFSSTDTNNKRALASSNIRGDRYEVKRHQKYPHALNFYSVPPTEEITIDEFEGFAFDRLQVLKALEGAILRNKSEEDIKDIDKKLSLPLHSDDAAKAYPLEEERRKDHISHFILRLAYSRTVDLRNWFLKYECALFKLRFIRENKEERLAFLNNENIRWKNLSQAERELMREKFTKEESNACSITYDDELFEIDFEKVPDLVAKRAVYIKEGKAYVPTTEQISLVMYEFRQRLAKALELASKSFITLRNERIMPMLDEIIKYDGRTQTTNNYSLIDNPNADNLAEHFPLCMQHLYQNLCEKHHLKHFARIQFNLFLKGIGLTVEEALAFWRKSFSEIDEAKFLKDYAYNIRHNYGLEGKRQDYKPLNCMSIISSYRPNSGEIHGCPFREFSQSNLSAKLVQMGVRDEEHIKEILNLTEGEHYQIACTKYFEITRGLSDKNNDNVIIGTIEHPNEYLNASVSNEKNRMKMNNKDKMVNK